MADHKRPRDETVSEDSSLLPPNVSETFQDQGENNIIGMDDDDRKRKAPKTLFRSSKSIDGHEIEFGADSKVNVVGIFPPGLDCSELNDSDAIIEAEFPLLPESTAHCPPLQDSFIHNVVATVREYEVGDSWPLSRASCSSLVTDSSNFTIQSLLSVMWGSPICRLQ